MTQRNYALPKPTPQFHLRENWTKTIFGHKFNCDLIGYTNLQNGTSDIYNV